MEKQPRLLLDYNSAYLSFKILDELDFVIGGYGKPTIEFIFTLNTFIETFVLNNSFYTSEAEIRHAQLINKYYFPNGRPILQCLTREARIGYISGLSNDVSTAVYVEMFEDRETFDIDKGIENYFKSSQLQRYEEFLKLKTNFHEEKDVNLLWAHLNEDRLIIGASLNTPIKIFKTLTQVSTYKHIQPVLPLSNFEEQVQNFSDQSISHEMFQKLKSIHNSKTADIKKYFGFDYQILPPLISILLSQCKSMSDIPDKLVQLRNDFTPLRNSIVEYERKVNEAQTIKEQLEAITAFNEFWDTFHKKYDKSSNRLLHRIWEIGNQAEGETAFDKAVDNESLSTTLKDLNIGKVAGKVLSTGWDWWKEKRILSRFKGITNAWDLFENRPILTAQYKKLEEVFGLVVTEKDLLSVKSRLDSIKKVKELPGH